jgi:hypothetical protein
MPGKQGNPKADAVKMAALAIVWGAVAGVAYLGLISKVIDLIKKSTGWVGPGAPYDTGLIAIDPAQITGHGHSQLYIIAISAIPFAIVAAIALGVVAWVRPALVPISGLLIPAGLIGIVGVGLVFINVVVNVKNRNDFLVALGTLVGLSIVLRLQHYIRRFHQSTPAVASLLVAVLVVAYIFLTNGTSLTAIILTDLDIYLALVAFAVVAYSGYRLVRSGRRLQRAK